MVSFWKRCYFPPVLTFVPQLREPMNGSTVASISPDDILARITKTSTGDPSPCLLPYIIPTLPSVSSFTIMFSRVSTSLYSYVDHDQCDHLSRVLLLLVKNAVRIHSNPRLQPKIPRVGHSNEPHFRSSSGCAFRRCLHPVSPNTISVLRGRSK